jgi:hypothetical protein
MADRQKLAGGQMKMNSIFSVAHKPFLNALNTNFDRNPWLTTTKELSKYRTGITFGENSVYKRLTAMQRQLNDVGKGWKFPFR